MALLPVAVSKPNCPMSIHIASALPLLVHDNDPDTITRSWQVRWGMMAIHNMVSTRNVKTAKPQASRGAFKAMLLKGNAIIFMDGVLKGDAVLVEGDALKDDASMGYSEVGQELVG
jgi:hypothetical protein